MKQFLLLIFFCKIAYAQSTNSDTLNQTDAATGLKQGYWIVYNSIKKLPAYPAEAKVEEGRFADSKKIGIWKMYYPSGILKSEITYTDNRPKGYAKMYYENGKLQEEGQWENNRWVGDYKSYHDNGQVFFDFKYNNSGKREGEQQYFYDNGQIMMKGEMHDGKEAGVWEERYENGDIRAKKAFNNGNLDPENTEVYAPKAPLPPKKEEPTSKETSKVVDTKVEQTNAAQKPFDGNGYAKLFLPGARISKDGEFKNYRLMSGKDYIYNTDGILERIAVYKDGKYVGEAPIEDKDK
ncbi:MAG: toxin-antitoxin system YwqK family antitoxin [Bacteroidetes bacterium]|nr:toxin-antitoxin system YwqK family antitoxin [Bacteroidota bacterium]